MVVVSAMSTADIFSFGLGYLMATRAFLRCIGRINFDYHYAAQSGLVQDVLEQLVKRPLALFGVAAHSSAKKLNTPNKSNGLPQPYDGKNLFLEYRWYPNATSF